MATEPTAAPNVAASESTTQNVGVELVPSGNSDQPVLSNFVIVQPASGVAMIDFGFLEPSALASVSRIARSGKKVPERLKGRLAARVAIPYDMLASLHQQAGRLLQAMTPPQKTAADKK